RRIGAWAHDRLFPPDLAGKRTVATIVAENERLTNTVAYVQKQLEAERRRNDAWAPLESLRDRCIPLAVSGGDAGPRGALALPADALVLDDRDWPSALQGQRLGVVTKVEPMRSNRKFAEIRIEPSSNLLLLNEVMVFVK